MSFSNIVPAAFLISAAALITTLFVRMRERDASIGQFEQTVLELKRQHRTLANKVAADASEVRATGLYEAKDHAVPGFRPMEFAMPGATTPSRMYVSLVPDLGLEDITAAHMEASGLLVQLTAAGQARLRALSRSRTTGGQAAREAIVVDDRVVAAPVFRREIQTDTFVVGGNAAMSSNWAQQLLDAVNASQKR